MRRGAGETARVVWWGEKQGERRHGGEEDLAVLRGWAVNRAYPPQSQRTGFPLLYNRAKEPYTQLS